MKTKRSELQQQLIDSLRESIPDCQAIYSFGSWGTAAERADSDIDLAVLPLHPLDAVQRWELGQQLASLARRDVDLVDLLRASTVLRMQVVANGQRLYAADVNAVEQFEDTVFSSYARLNEERRDILDDVRQREVFMASDVLSNKVDTIERGLGRIAAEYQGHQDEFETNFTRQDAIILNLQRACEAAIDAAMHLVRIRRLGVPQESRDAFDLLKEAGVITAPLCDRLKAMVGFRNIAVHDYRKLNLEVVRSILEHRLGDFQEFGRVVLRAEG